MTFLGKIFTVLIFIMSLVFMAFALAVYATQRNWRDVVKNEVTTEKKPLGLEHQLEQAGEKYDQSQAENERLRYQLAMERAARRQALALLETHRRQLAERLAASKRRNQELVASERTAITELSTAHVSLNAIQDEVAGLRDALVTTQQDLDTQLDQVVALTDLRHQSRGEQRRLKESRDQLAADLAKSTRVLRAHDLKKETPLGNRPPTGLEGVVLAVNVRSGLVEISIGSDDGLRNGHQFDVSNKNRYLGRIIIVKTEPDRAVGKIKYRKGEIRKGDRVVASRKQADER